MTGRFFDGLTYNSKFVY